MQLLSCNLFALPQETTIIIPMMASEIRRNSLRVGLPVLLAGLGLLLMLLFTGCNPLPTPPDRVFIVADGERHALETRAGTVREVLVEADITLEG
ncbi:MAG: ubiquitin-like domain-containing protein, partial [Chloroflexota bacterium]|nr:ubiquitin-like domain-containing protein [Chloroflexota bacterium]